MEELVLSQEGARVTVQRDNFKGDRCASVIGLTHNSQGSDVDVYEKAAHELTESNRATRLQRSKQLLKQYPDEKADFIWFTDEKIFTVSRPKNTQNDRMYAPVTTKKRQIPAARLLRTRTTFTQSVMVSVGVSKLGVTDLIFVDPGIKVNGEY